MKSISLGIIITLLSATAQTQTVNETKTSFANNGIHFTEGLNWKQIIDKAKTENKFIFVDCYATWCGPCKMMDQMVYPNEKVGAYLNARFISVKLQMDKTSSDNDHIKRLYDDAGELNKKYNINSLPTYLFFSPYGKLLHRNGGAISVEEFIRTATDATRHDRQYFTLLEDYKQGIKNYKSIAYLMEIAKRIGDVYNSRMLSTDYLSNFLYKQPESVWLKKENLQIMMESADLIRTTDKVFSLYYHQPTKVDKVMWKGHAQEMTDWIIMNEEIKQKIYTEGKPNVSNPDWKLLSANIEKKYSRRIAERIILNAQIAWYDEQKDYPLLIKYTIKQKEIYGLDTAGIGKNMLNNMIYDLIFLHSNDLVSLNKAIAWMDMLIKTEPDHHEWLDTYANLLYKAGLKEEGISWEEKAIQITKEKKLKALKEKELLTKPEEIEPYNSLIKKLDNDIKGYQDVIAKMNKGLSTWTD